MSLGEAHAMVRLFLWLTAILVGSVIALNIGMSLGFFLLVMIFFHPFLIYVYEIAGTLIIFSMVVWRFVR